MPARPHWLPDDVDIESSAGRFNVNPAVAIGIGEGGDESYGRADALVREVVGDWILDEDPGLGPAEARDGSAGRGAESWVPVVQWLGDSIAGGVIDVLVAAAFVKTLGRLHKWRDQRKADSQPASVEVSRGAAALVAAAHVSQEFGEQGTLAIEAVEEPSTIAGNDISELSYVGVEPWLVLLRNQDDHLRYIVVVMPEGTVSGALRVPFLPFEDMFLRPAEFAPRRPGTP